MEQRKNKRLPSLLIKELIVLKCNSMSFLGRIFHQIKGTAMGTSLAVSFANIFMSKFEKDMLNEYHAQTGLQLTMWLHFIDDVFAI